VLARVRGIEDGGWMTIVTERAEIEARAKVTERMRPLQVDGKAVHQVGLPWHWGYSAPYAGDSTNDLEPCPAIRTSRSRSPRRSRATCGRGAAVGVDGAPERRRAAEWPVAPDHDDPLAEAPQEVKQ